MSSIISHNPKARIVNETIPRNITITPFGSAGLPSLLKGASLLPLNYTKWFVNQIREESRVILERILWFRGICD